MRTFIVSALATSLLTFAVPAEAGGPRNFHHRHHHHHHHQHYHNRNHWVAPAIIGGAIAGAALYHYANPVVTYQETIQNNRPIVCTEWREVRTYDGQIKQERTCYQQ